MRDSFIVYRSFYESLLDMSETKRGKMLSIICEYVLNENEPKDLTGSMSAIWKLIKPQLDANNRRYKNGNEGGRPKSDKKETETKPVVTKNETDGSALVTKNKNLNETKPKPNDNVNVNEDENVNVNVDVNAASAKLTNDNVIDLPLPSSDDVNDILSIPQTTDDDDHNYFRSLSPEQRGVARWFQHYAFPPDKKHLYIDIITPRRLIDWAEQWLIIKDDPAIIPYLQDLKTYPWPKEDEMDAQGKVSAFRIYVEFAFRVERDKFAPHFKDLTYLCKPHNGKPNIEHLGIAFQKWMNAQQKIMDSIIPKYGN
jgi:hypothetical protein